MTSILKLSEANEAKDTASSETAKKPLDPASDWESLRGLTTNVYQKRPSTRLRTALLVVLLIVGFASLGVLLHNHMPALMNLGEQLSETVDRLASPTPTPSTGARASELPDLRPAHNKHRSSHAVPDFPPEQAYDPAFHPFYATAVIDGRRIALLPNHNVVVLDMGSGTWNFASETE